MSWREQYDRIQRGIERISANKSREEFEDDLFHLFVDCWQMKDWIQNDSTISYRKRQRIKDAVHGDTVLRYCQDIANARKHLKLRGPRIRRGRPRKPAASVIGEIRVGAEDIAINYVVVDKKGRKIAAAHEMAQQVKEKWKKILTKHGLKPPE